MEFNDGTLTISGERKAEYERKAVSGNGGPATIEGTSSERTSTES